ncbi:hypothetical protein N7461_002053 [Penicillium sp. DV-2018c]|nr:hypothetical protein N7461_002053 [Penicillium sp. DV-2018c]
MEAAPRLGAIDYIVDLASSDDNESTLSLAPTSNMSIRRHTLHIATEEAHDEIRRLFATSATSATAKGSTGTENAY